MARTAVIIGDLQAGITRNHPIAAGLVPRAADLASAARGRGDLVVFIRTALRTSGADVAPRNPGVQAIFTPDYLFGAPGVALDPGLGALADDVVVTKHRASAFAATDLDLVLRSSGVERVAIAGVATSAMVAATVYAACDLDYEVTVVADVCADLDPDVHDFFIEKVFPGRAVTVASAGDLGG